MNLLEEYSNQQAWRHWDSYLRHIPHSGSDLVLDLGCSVGGFSDTISKVCQGVIGVDLEQDFIVHCDSKRRINQRFLCSDFREINFDQIPVFQGVWSSFSLSYLNEPKDFIGKLFDHLDGGGWIALVDVSCFLSGNLSPESMHHGPLRAFELNSGSRGSYDFDFGSKMVGLLKSVGFEIYYQDDDVTDLELNFDGPASAGVKENWKARLQRMQGLKAAFPISFKEIERELLESLMAPGHRKNGNVKYVVGRKI